MKAYLITFVISLFLALNLSGFFIIYQQISQLEKEVSDNKANIETTQTNIDDQLEAVTTFYNDFLETNQIVDENVDMSNRNWDRAEERLSALEYQVASIVDYLR